MHWNCHEIYHSFSTCALSDRTGDPCCSPPLRGANATSCTTGCQNSALTSPWALCRTLVQQGVTTRGLQDAGGRASQTLQLGAPRLCRQVGRRGFNGTQRICNRTNLTCPAGPPSMLASRRGAAGYPRINASCAMGHTATLSTVYTCRLQTCGTNGYRTIRIPWSGHDRLDAA